VNIDFGDVTTRMRRILVDRKKRRRNLGSRLASRFLNTSEPGTIRLLRKGMAEWGYRGITLGHELFQKLGLLKGDVPAATTGPMAIKTQALEMVRRPLRVELPAHTLRSALKLEERTTVPIIRDPEKAGEESEAVFYFPGCGSERLFSDIGLASIAMLYDLGTQVVLPPGYLCCGYPQLAMGQEVLGRRITTENRVLFHRVATTLNYMDIRTVIVSCGTCMDQLQKYQFEKIFPGCRLLDIHEYLMEKGVRMEGGDGQKYLYHDPCHSPMKRHNPLDVAAALTGGEVQLSDRCCGEAGMLGVARPDIASQVRFRKREELQQGIHALSGGDRVESGEVKMLTACPACQQGLNRYADETGLQVRYPVEELAQAELGEGWQQRAVERISAGGIERVLL
jgi:Fe-S oxidoreductase